LPESELHRRLKYAMAKELVEMGYQSGVEVRTAEGGYIDVQGRRGKEIINIELWKTHLPDWLIVKFQEAREIKENIYTELLIRVSENYTKVFRIEVLINGLVESGYFNDESANNYVNKMIKEGKIVIQEDKKIKELFIEIAKRLSESAYGLLYRDALIKSLVDRIFQ
jgi:polyhydroxyalkanoate synthesis regulator phasin